MLRKHPDTAFPTYVHFENRVATSKLFLRLEVQPRSTKPVKSHHVLLSSITWMSKVKSLRIEFYISKA